MVSADVAICAECRTDLTDPASRRHRNPFVGLDPLFVANEGKLVAFVAPQDADEVLAAMRRHEYGAEAVVIGQCVEADPGMVVTKTGLGGTRVVDIPIGEQLARIC